MHEIELWNWIDGLDGKRHRSRWKMTREEALQHDPDATQVEGTREVRRLPEGPGEQRFNSKLPPATD